MKDIVALSARNIKIVVLMMIMLAHIRAQMEKKAAFSVAVLRQPKRLNKPTTLAGSRLMARIPALMEKTALANVVLPLNKAALTVDSQSKALFLAPKEMMVVAANVVPLSSSPFLSLKEVITLADSLPKARFRALMERMIAVVNVALPNKPTLLKQVNTLLDNLLMAHFRTLKERVVVAANAALLNDKPLMANGDSPLTAPFRTLKEMMAVAASDVRLNSKPFLSLKAPTTPADSPLMPLFPSMMELMIATIEGRTPLPCHLAPVDTMSLNKCIIASIQERPPFLALMEKTTPLSA